MANGQLFGLLGRLAKLDRLPLEDRSDAEVLERFAAQGDEAAFQLLLRRHGPMVLGVCRRILGDVHTAEDVFQATFLVLAKKAGSIRRHTSLGSWLYRVAFHFAVASRSQSARQRTRERAAARPDAHEPPEAHTGERNTVLDEEMERLPEKYRAPLVLCYFQGKTHEEAARALSWPIGSMSRRLDRAKQLLRARLVRRGLAFSVGGLAVVEPSVVSAALGKTTVEAALAVAAGRDTAGLISQHAAALVAASLRTNVAGWFTIAAGALLALGLAVVLAVPPRPAPPAPNRPLSTVADAPADGPAPRTVKLFLLAGEGNMEGVVPVPPEVVRGADVRPDAEDLAPGPRARAGDETVWISRFSYSPDVNFKWLTLADRPASHRWGLEIGLGRALRTALPDTQIALFKYAYGGSKLRDWSREDHSDQYWKTSYQLYPKFLRHLEESASELRARGFTVEVAGLVWLQGEDAFDTYHAEVWKKNPQDPIAWSFATGTRQIFTDLRADLGKLLNADGRPLNLPVVLGRVSAIQMHRAAMEAAAALSGRTAADHISGVEHKRREQVYIVEKLNPDKDIFWVDTDDLTPYPNEAPRPRTGYHFLPTSYHVLGERCARAFLTRSSVIATAPAP